MSAASVADDIAAEILDLKNEDRRHILAHYYQEGEIQELADYHRRQPQARPRGHQGRYADHRLLRRPLHGRDGQDAQPDEDACCCPTCRPAAASPTAARPTSSPAIRRCSASNGRQVPDRHLHQQLRGGEGAVRLGRHLAATPRRSSAGCRRTTRSCSCPTGTSGRICRKSPAAR